MEKSCKDVDERFQDIAVANFIVKEDKKIIPMVTRVITKPPALSRVRLASTEDVPAIMDLLTESMIMNFRIQCPQDVTYLIENSVLSICALDVNDVIAGFLSAREYPLIPSVHPNAWEEYIWTKYKYVHLPHTLLIPTWSVEPEVGLGLVKIDRNWLLSCAASVQSGTKKLKHADGSYTGKKRICIVGRAVELNSRNTLFLHLLCWNSGYGREVVDSMVKSVFMHDPYVMYIAMVKSLIKQQLLVPGQSRSESVFRRVTASEKGVQSDLLPSLSVADRSEACPGLKIRRAVEEDNDDLVPIIERHSERLREMYGDFYISELIARHPESDRVLIVCEAKDLAVGFMCFNTQINFEALEEDYELAPFVGLRKLTQPLARQSVIQNELSSSFDGSQICIVGPGGQYMSEVTARAKIASRVDGPESVAADFPPSHLGPSEHLEIIRMLDEDEDEIEFDIVNIDTNLLTVPKFLSYDSIQGNNPTDNIIKKLNSPQSSHPNENKKEPSKQIPPGPPPEPTRFIGFPNAFLLELFAMHEDYDERYGFDMLTSAYDLFPNRDYCILCVPSKQSPFPLLEHFTLVPPYSFRKRFIKDSLYVAHINSVKCALKVRPAEAHDLHRLSDIVEHAPRAEMLTDLFATSITSSSIHGYVFLSQNQPMGMAVLGPLEDGMAIRTQFELDPEPRRPGTDGTILAGIVTPIMEPHYRWFLRELLRHSQYSSVFWMCRLFSKGDACATRNLMSLAGHMTPVHPRRAIPNISGDKNLDKIYKEMSSPFALWVLERPLSGMPKVCVNSGIVVVGASRTGLAFLESLLLGPTSSYLTFSNVTLVSEHGVPTVPECLKAADTCIPRDGRYTDRYLKSVPFFFYFDVIAAVMVGIDRKKKCIRFKNGTVMHYDELVLTCGQQFQHPEYLRKPLQLVKEVERGRQCNRMQMDNPQYKPDSVPLPPELPDNVMIINDLFEANRCMRKLIVMISEYKDSAICLSEEHPVVIYGSCIEVYSCMAALIELGVSPEMIVFVEPFPSDDPLQLRVNCFNNVVVDERVQHNIQSSGVRIFRKTHFVSWRQRDMRVEYLNFMTDLHALKQPCFAFFYYGIKAINVYAFKAINDCGLVYDGGLVVGPVFDTNDPHVYGAGTSVKYSRRLHADTRSHRHFCSEDVGEALAHLFLRKMDPFVMGASTTSASSEMLPRYSATVIRTSLSSYGSGSSICINMGSSKNKWQPVMRFESAIVQYVQLPGPLFYLKVRMPGREIPMAVQSCMPHQGHTLFTDKNSNYFRLQLNNLHCVNALTCLSQKPFSSEVMTQLYGKHEAFFNKLLTRFKMNLISDLYDFFVQPWMSAVYQEPFDDLIREINEDKISKDATDSRIDRFIGYGRRNSTVVMAPVSSKVDIPSECGQSKETRDDAAKFWDKIKGEGIVISHLVQYLKRNSIINPHFAVPEPDCS